MIKFDIITIFPDIFNSYFEESIIKRAQGKKLIKINTHNLRDWTSDKHKTLDDKPFGGGAGMVLKVEPIYRAVEKLKKKKNSKIVLLSAKGKKFDQEMARKFSKLEQIILICGRYEGVDERVAKHIADEEISIGDYVLTGGELPAMAIVDAVSRLVPGVIKEKSLSEESFETAGSLEYPQYTRPEIFLPKGSKRAWKAPKVLLSGNHKEIGEWQAKHKKTAKRIEK
ncbi:tRNA (guanosine(37)-N1)-methyltransferase TrmD [Candidatus Parcubacteria bacterium]|nr:tRNA (guanosine(37)-N1)-methyltransferase TrmD [Candidatus Parcubacteria bacterium]